MITLPRRPRAPIEPVQPVVTPRDRRPAAPR
ncbi:MAG: hypothetical protein AVDCRST_MAG68-1842, partial [uncultured Gemmatimonadetes bacterium]